MEWFPFCELGAEPPLALFGLPIVIDAALANEERIVFPAGAHGDAVEVDTSEWLECENVQTLPGLGAPLH